VTSRPPQASELAAIGAAIDRVQLAAGTSYRPDLERAKADAKRLLEGKLALELGSAAPLPRFVAMAGGTNVGKSSMFNALLGKAVAGPTETAGGTKCAVLHVGRAHRTVADRPELLPGYRKEPLTDVRRANELHGQPTAFVSVDVADLPWVLCDSPDVDSRVVVNAGIGRDVLVLADTLVFVTTDQKYLDRLPLEFFQEAERLGKELVVLLNKVEDQAKGEDILADFVAKVGIPRERATCVVVPFVRGAPLEGAIDRALEPVRALLAAPSQAAKRAALAGAARGVERNLAAVLDAVDRERAQVAKLGARLVEVGAERRREFERFAGTLADTEFHELGIAIGRILEGYGIPYVKEVVAALRHGVSELAGMLRLSLFTSAPKLPPLEARRQKSFAEAYRHVEAADRAWRAHLRTTGEHDELARALHDACSAKEIPARDVLYEAYLGGLAEREQFAAAIEDEIRAWLDKSPAKRLWLQAFKILMSGGLTATVVFLTGGLAPSDLLYGPLAALAGEAMFRHLAPPQFFKTFRDKFVALELTAFDAALEVGCLAPHRAHLPTGKPEETAKLRADLAALAQSLEKGA